MECVNELKLWCRTNFNFSRLGRRMWWYSRSTSGRLIPQWGTIVGLGLSGTDEARDGQFPPTAFKFVAYLFFSRIGTYAGGRFPVEQTIIWLGLGTTRGVSLTHVILIHNLKELGYLFRHQRSKKHQHTPGITSCRNILKIIQNLDDLLDKSTIVTLSRDVSCCRFLSVNAGYNISRTSLITRRVRVENGYCRF